jgi:hypothetical protein
MDSMLDKKEGCAAERDSRSAMDARPLQSDQRGQPVAALPSGSGLHNLFQRWPVADDQGRSLKLQQLFFLEF